MFKSKVSNSLKALLSEKKSSNTFQRLYGSEALAFNFHNLIFHLCDDVERHGSSSYHTMFSFESVQGYFLKKIKGNRGFSSQMLKSNITRAFLAVCQRHRSAPALEALAAPAPAPTGPGRPRPALDRP